MDPLSQATLGASLAQSVSRREDLVRAAIIGGLAGLAPDLDVLIRSSSDPLLTLEYHRQFTHSLLFVPIGAALVALVLHPLLGRGWSFRLTYTFSLLGFATHGLLDACTSYGTQLFWPLSDARIAWNVVSVIDPLLTVPLVTLVLVGLIRRQRRWSRMALCWVAAYLLLGLMQQERARSAADALAAERGHVPERLLVKPAFATTLLWKVVYEYEGRFYVDALRLVGQAQVFPGSSIERLHSFPGPLPQTQQLVDIERFRRFSNSYLALDPDHPRRIIDVRYSVVPNEIDPLWAIDVPVTTDPTEHVRWVADRRATREQTDRWLAMLLGG